MPLTCNCLDEILRGCENNIGGLKAAYILPFNEVLTISATPGTGLITAITIGTACDGYVQFEFNKNSSSYVEDAAIDLVNGSTFYTTTTSLVIPRRDVDKRNALALVAAGQQDLSIILLDNNGVFWLQGKENGANLTAQGEGSGVAKADGSKYSLSFVAEEPEQMYVIDPTIISALLA